MLSAFLLAAAFLLFGNEFVIARPPTVSKNRGKPSEPLQAFWLLDERLALGPTAAAGLQFPFALLINSITCSVQSQSGAVGFCCWTEAENFRGFDVDSCGSSFSDRL